MVREVFRGVGLLLRGFGYWRRIPNRMLLGLLPAALVFLAVVAGLIVLGLAMPAIVDALTPFDDDWPQPLPGVIAAAIITLIYAVAVVLAAVTFTAVTLAVGDPFYERIWRAVELDLGGTVPDAGAGFWSAVRDSAALIAMGAVLSIGVALLGLVPLVGTVLAPVAGVILSGRLLAIELSSRGLDARGIRSGERRMLRRTVRWQLLGFGVATQLLFLIPLGAVLTMPAAVAGSTILARTALERAGSQRLLSERGEMVDRTGNPV